MVDLRYIRPCYTQHWCPFILCPSSFIFRHSSLVFHPSSFILRFNPSSFIHHPSFIISLPSSLIPREASTTTPSVRLFVFRPFRRNNHTRLDPNGACNVPWQFATGTLARFFAAVGPSMTGPSGLQADGGAINQPGEKLRIIFRCQMRHCF